MTCLLEKVSSISAAQRELGCTWQQGKLIGKLGTVSEGIVDPYLAHVERDDFDAHLLLQFAAETKNTRGVYSGYSRQHSGSWEGILQIRRWFDEVLKEGHSIRSHIKTGCGD